MDFLERFVEQLLSDDALPGDEIKADKAKQQQAVLPQAQADAS